MGDGRFLLVRTLPAQYYVNSSYLEHWLVYNNLSVGFLNHHNPISYYVFLLLSALTSPPCFAILPAHCMSPRSILKADLAKSSTKCQSHVHFPPSPSQLVSATYYAYPSAYYDRTPLVVAPNECALPSRNCPERTYVICDREARLLKQVKDDVEQKSEYDGDADARRTSLNTPRSYLSSQHHLDYFSPPSSYYPTPHTSSNMPELTWSESEDSDGLISPPLDSDSCHNFSALHMSSTATHDRTRSQRPFLSSAADVSQDVLAFLPHPPLHPHERKRSLSPRNRQRKEHTYSSSDSDHTPAFTTARPRPLRSRYATSEFNPDIPPDSGCLGGF